MTRTARTSRRRTGVTLIEMMVALAITTFVILIVNQLFNEVITTVGRGTQAGEILQRSRAFDEQIATETQLLLSGSKDPTDPKNWWGRMVGPAGRDGAISASTEPGGFLAIVQRRINAPLTIDEAMENVNHFRPIRSDQLMFIYDQAPKFDQTGKKRLPPLAPAGNYTYAGDMRNSLNADYVRMWYGHVAQRDENGNYIGDIGEAIAGNPNLIAQDWVLGRHALFMTDSSGNPGTEPYGVYVNNAFSTANVVHGPGANLSQGFADVLNATLDNLVHDPGGLAAQPNKVGYQGTVLGMMFARDALQTSAKPVTTTFGNLGAWDVSPTHTYFMGGVSDFIVEFAGDLVTGETNANGGTFNPDGQLDRDTAGRIRWYSAYANSPGATNGYNPDYPITYEPPAPASYPPGVDNPPLNFFPRADAAFVWQHEGSPEFTSWPWMLRIRYRLHDRRGQFEGRQITDSSGELVPEPGAWFEIIVPVNHQGIEQPSP